MAIGIGIAIGLLIGGGVVALAVFGLRGNRLAAARRTRQLLLTEARREADATRREAQIETREEAVKLRAEIEADIQERRASSAAAEERIRGKESEVDRRMVELVRREQGLADREVHAKSLQEQLKQAKH